LGFFPLKVFLYRVCGLGNLVINDFNKFVQAVVLRFLHNNVAAGNLDALGKQDKEGTGFKVVVAAVRLHFDVGLLAVVKGDVNVQAEDFPKEEGGECFGILQPEIPDSAVYSAGKEVLER
jgi:hypothetical protein